MDECDVALGVGSDLYSLKRDPEQTHVHSCVQNTSRRCMSLHTARYCCCQHWLLLLPLVLPVIASNKKLLPFTYISSPFFSQENVLETHSYCWEATALQKMLDTMTCCHWQLCLLLFWQVIGSCSSTGLHIWGVTDNTVQNIFIYLFYLWASA